MLYLLHFDQNAPPGDTADWYAGLTECRLYGMEIDRIRNFDIDQFTKALRAKIADFDSLPDPVQEALFDMAYNLGIGGLKKYKQLMAAIQTRDWAAAAEQCHRKGISEERNQETRRLFCTA